MYSVREGTEVGFSPGNLVTARGREWVVLPDSTDDFLLLRPLGGLDDDIAGVLASEGVEPASFPPPAADDLGDHFSAQLLTNALRIGFRSTAGPFRCLGSIAVQPRAYQLVPLMLALRQDVVRLLIADDVGIGKTVEAGLIATELLAVGEARGLSVLCSPALAEQWQSELREKFGMEAELVLSSTVRRLERGRVGSESIFERYPITVVSTDFIKSSRRRHEFLRTCPDMVIVDEVHTCVAAAGQGGSGRTQRYELMQELAKDPRRHMILASATPHSGNEEAFRNLLGLLDPALERVDLDDRRGRELLARADCGTPPHCPNGCGTRQDHVTSRVFGKFLHQFVPLRPAGPALPGRGDAGVHLIDDHHVRAGAQKLVPPPRRLDEVGGHHSDRIALEDRLTADPASFEPSHRR
jgi:hypothetical protein